MRFCTHCGAAADPEARSCANCGTLHSLGSSAPEDLLCDSCNGAIGRAWRHCATCGAPTPAAAAVRMTRTSIAAEAPSFVPGGDTIEADETAAPPPAEERWPAKLHP